MPARLSFDNPNAKISSLSCGSRHSLALTANGEVYSWGYQGALGIEGKNEAGSPVRIPQEYFQNEKILSVSAADDFSIALGEKGNLYAWGDGLLSLPDFNVESNVPVQSKLVEDLVSKRHAKITKITAIDQFIILLLDNGRLYSFGKSKAGVFGARQNPLVLSDVDLKSFAKTYDELYKNEKIVDFEASSDALIFRTETDKVFYNGMFDKYQPTPFPGNYTAKSIWATTSSVGIITPDNKLFYVNDRIIDDSEVVCSKSRLYECEDENFGR